VVFQVRRGLAGSERAKAPSCDGAIDIGPLWNSILQADFRMRPCQFAAVVFSERAPLMR
jgi:hypothetical protein